MKATIYHNPGCGTSRNTLAMIRNAGIEPTIIEYLQTPPSRAELVKMIADAGLTVRQAIREKGTPYAEFGLDDRGPDRRSASRRDAERSDPHQPALRRHAARHAPVRAHPRRCSISCRTPHKGAFAKEDGEQVHRCGGQAYCLICPQPPANICGRSIWRRSTAARSRRTRPRILILYGSLRDASPTAGCLPRRRRACSSTSAAKCGYSIRRDCRCLTRRRQAIRRCRNCANCRSGRKGRSGSSPERHGAMTGIMKAQIDWIPLIGGLGAANAGQDARRHAGVGRLAVFQRR